MNRVWHQKHKMPERATDEERMKWHVEHAQACACRPIPARLLERLSEAQRVEAKKGHAKGAESE